ncbi:GTP-binding protein 8-like [Lineus longissimus]|uniref:GTP-binding protein 8-like n=1 Tax=Lineus longissimus TaxID=88925 RepID=UPI00315D98F9
MLPKRNSRVYLNLCRRLFHTSQKLQIRTLDPYVDVFARLQSNVQVPLVKKDEKLFLPSLEKMKEAEKLFRPSRSHAIEWSARRVVDADSYPVEKLPEVAFLGRSNVGKSSLIQAIFSRVDPKLLKIGISKKPGHTKSLHFFNVGKALSLVDAPGYGFNMPENFERSVETYLKTRKTLTRTFLLLDSAAGITKHDETGIEMLEDAGVPYVVVLTKVDKISDRRLIESVLAFTDYQEKKMHCCLSQPFMVSSHTMIGVPLLQCFIAYLTGNLAIDGH